MRRINISQAVALLLAVSAHMLIISYLDRAPQTSDTLSKHHSGKFVVSMLSPDKSGSTIDKQLLKEHPISQKPSLHSNQGRKSDSDTSVIGTQIENAIYYFKTNEVTQKPRVIVDLPTDFSLPTTPQIPQPLELTLRINDAGNVDEVLIAESYLDEDAKRQISNAFKSMFFQAALIGETAVASEIHIEVFGTDF